MKQFTPILFSSLKDYNGQKFMKDVFAGVIVAIIALPLSVALAVASNVNPEQGLYTAIIAGFLISFFGGSKVQISGPTAALSTVVASIVTTKGMDALVVATVMAGVLLIIMGLCKFGSFIKFIPYTITTGFTAGIAVMIFIGQLKEFFGVTYMNGEVPIAPVDKIEALINNFSTFNADALIIGSVCLLVLFLFPRLTKKIPVSIVAIFAGVLMAKLLPLNVSTLGDLYTINNSLPTPSIPSFSFAQMRELFPDAMTIAILGAIVSLLSCVVSDGMSNSKTRSNTELVAQGIGNIASVIFGGIPATGAVARSTANVENGGITPISGMVHAITLTIVLVVLMPYASHIPMPAIAAILISVAYNMCQWRPFVRLVRTAPKSDVTVLVLTFILAVVFDLMVAVEFGMIIAAALFIKRTSDEVNVRNWQYVEDVNDPDSINLRHVDKSIRVYELSGPLFYAATDQLSRITTKDYTKCLILRMRSVPCVDATAMRSLEQILTDCNKKGITLILSHVNPQPKSTMKKAGFVDKVGRDNFCKSIDFALERANEVIK